jgi:hypothetical protein
VSSAARLPDPLPGAAPAAPAAKPLRTRLLRLALALAVAAGLGWWLLRQIDLAPVLASARRLPLAVWPLAMAGLLGGHLLRARRLQLEWGSRRAASLWACWRLVLVHNAAVLVLPLRAGEAGYLWLVHRQFGVGWREAGISLLWWRIQDAAALALLAGALLPPWPDVLRLPLAAAAALLLAGLWRPLQTRWLPQRWRSAPAHPQAGWWCSVANWTLKVAVNGGGLALLAGLDPLTALRGSLGGELAGVQPLQGVAGLGTYEAGVWLSTGAPAQAGTLLAAALAVHAISLAVALGAAAVAQLPWPGRPAAA